MSYDTWLEKPYQDMYEQTERFMNWAENRGYDLTNARQFVEAEEDFYDYMDAMEEVAAEDAYERAMEARYDDRMEMWN